MSSDLSNWPAWALITVGLATAMSLTLMIIALIRVVQTPSEQLTLPRAAWIVLLFIQFIGPIAFLVAGRKPPVIDDSHATRQGPLTSTDRVLDVLYPDDRQS